MPSLTFLARTANEWLVALTGAAGSIALAHVAALRQGVCSGGAGGDVSYGAA
jgi:hypothetical protein